MFEAYLKNYYVSRRVRAEDIQETAVCLSANPITNASGYLVNCPSHEDRVASLSIGPGTRAPMIMYCHAGCSYEEIRRGILKKPSIPNSVRALLDKEEKNIFYSDPSIAVKPIENPIRATISQPPGIVSFSIFYPASGQPGERCIAPHSKKEPWEDFKERHRQFTCVESKENQSMERITGAIYKPGFTRGKKGIDYVTFLILDFDKARQSMRDAVFERRLFGRALNEYLGFGHTTISNKKDVFHYRLFLPLKAWVPIEGWDASIILLREDLKRMESLDQTAWKDPSKMYITPCFVKENLPQISFIEFKGRVPLSVSHH